MKSISLAIIGCFASLASASDLVVDNAVGPWGDVAVPVPSLRTTSPREPSRIPYILLAGIGVGVIYWRRGATR